METGTATAPAVPRLLFGSTKSGQGATVVKVAMAEYVDISAPHSESTRKSYAVSCARPVSA